MHLSDHKTYKNFTTLPFRHAANQRESWSNKARLSRNDTTECPILSFSAKRVGALPGAPSFRALCESVGAMLPGTTVFVASVENPAYDSLMAKAHKFDLGSPAPVLDEEDEETLAAIDEGIRDAEAGRVVPAEKARELLPKWTTASPIRKTR